MMFLLLRSVFIIGIFGVGLWFYYSYREYSTAEAETEILSRKATSLKAQIETANETLKELEAEKGRLYQERKTLADKSSALLERSIALQREWLNIKCELTRYKILKERIDTLTQKAETLFESLR